MENIYVVKLLKNNINNNRHDRQLEHMVGGQLNYKFTD